MKKVLAVVLLFAVMAGLAVPAAAASDAIVGIEAVWTEEAVISLFTPVCYPSNTDVILKYESGETELITVWDGAYSYVLGKYSVDWEITDRTADEVTVTFRFKAGQTWTTEMVIPLVSLEQHIASHQPLAEIKENNFTRLTQVQQVFILKPNKNGKYYLPDQRECLPVLGADYNTVPIETILDENNNAIPMFVNLKKGDTYYLVTTTDYIGREYSRSRDPNFTLYGPMRKLNFFGLLWSLLTFGMLREMWIPLPNGSKVDVYAFPSTTGGRDISKKELLQTNLSVLVSCYFYNRFGFFA